jgi:hypothetical protein
MITLAIANLCIGVGLLVVGLPLAFRKVPMNPFYGWRTKAAFESEQSWCDINAHYGRRITKLGAPMLLVGLGGFLISETYLVSYTVASCVVPLLALVLPIERLFPPS